MKEVFKIICTPLLFAFISGCSDLSICADNMDVAYWDADKQKCICREGQEHKYCHQPEDTRDDNEEE